MLKMVVMKLIELKIEDAPARCSARIAKSTAGPGCPEVDSGAYAVQPMPAPQPERSRLAESRLTMQGPAPSTNSDRISSEKAAGNNQNEMLFMRGKAMSGAPIISGAK